MAETAVVPVDTPSRSYDVLVGRGVLADVGRLARETCGGDVAFVVTDTNVGPLYGDVVTGSLKEAGYAVGSCAFPAGEQSKTLSTLDGILQAMAVAGCTRDSVVVALGGGVAGDMGGLAAALYMRGVKVLQVPTSLLAMVDSSVGGKTAVDLPQGKNLVGAFWQPELVVADAECLETVPPELFTDSLGEVVKHAVLASPELFALLQGRCLGQRPLDLDLLQEVVAANVTIKRDVVNADEQERGLRQTLNLGHTAGHAIEAAASFSLGHGTCVAEGLCIVARGAAKRGLLSPEDADAIVACVANQGLPTEPSVPADDFLALSRADKKRHGSVLNVVVPRRIGRCEVVPMDEREFRSLVLDGLA
ncbi:3-dehydroquinate synthase [Olsenella sp. YH-ols2217]|uniref:3-dehydroquinate synthase n=1 Tax=Kribbibacterium absianum TaxID=3044210 RepID=A0ABT6ZIJ9_9ACTN|nr:MULTISPECIES: 3-dehydroquinate synthase [unclassified Olsenella]MDJ1121391.1 3-dehydroquinate synthase [Olsenella sp. YH-ols2216]MDJ1128881.1 3-dehydroquinate synthase [Olsenella sp. YH-ols2217]